MSFSTLNALSPLDGRYASKLSNLRTYMSEYGYMHRRVQVEIAWFIALSDANFKEFPPLSSASRDYLHQLVAQFSEADGQAIKDISKPMASLCILLAPAKTSTIPVKLCN